jgi:nitrate/TMAO reductase-like tetraheme cytochrome c subunit
MLPVNYENHCRACHPLDFGPEDAPLVMEHALQPAEVHASLWQTFSAEYLKKNPALLEERIPPSRIPGRTESPGLIEARSAIARNVSAAEKVLFGAKRCGECHQYEDQAGKPVKVVDHFDPAAPVRVTLPEVPVVWWRSARFTHSSHRGVDCRGCHERAYPDSRDAEKKSNASHHSSDILLPGIKTCVECHAPRGQAIGASQAAGGAAFDCTECHRYHNGDAVLMGLNPTDPAPTARLTIDEFLRGLPPPARP